MKLQRPLSNTVRNRLLLTMLLLAVVGASITSGNQPRVIAQDGTPVATMEMPAGNEPSILLPILDDLPAATPDLTTYPVKVQNCGRELTFDAPPQKVISLWQPPTEILLALGLGDRFVALAGTYAPYPDVFRPVVAKIPQIGTAMAWPSREVLLSQKPDFVISEGLDSFGYDASKGYATVAEIEATGATVFSSAACSFADPQTRTTEEILTDIRALGKIFGVSQRAEALIARMKAQRDEVIAKVSKLEPTRVAFYNGGTGPLFVLNIGLWADLLKTAGGSTVLTTTDFQVSLEAFASANPDVILVGYYPGQEPSDSIAFLKQMFPTVAAVQNGRLVPIATINTEASIRVMYGLDEIARGLHPEAFK